MPWIMVGGGRGMGGAMQFLHYLICVFSALLHALSACDTEINTRSIITKNCVGMFFIASTLKKRSQTTYINFNDNQWVKLISHNFIRCNLVCTFLFLLPFDSRNTAYL